MEEVEADSNPVREREWVDLFAKHTTPTVYVGSP